MRFLAAFWRRYMNPCAVHCGHGEASRCCRCGTTPEGGWLVRPTSELVVHAYPAVDLIEHELDDDGECICGPATTPVEREVDGETLIAWVYLHQSADGREYLERGEQIPRELP